MKKLFIIFILFNNLAYAGKSYLSKNGDGGGWITAGDTVIVSASLNPWAYIYIGTSNVVVLSDGNVQAGGISIQAQHVNVVGPIYVNQHEYPKWTGAGISIDQYSAHIDISKVYVDSVSYGLWIKNEYFCDSALSDWVLDDISVHDCTFNHITQHGTYIGATEQTNTTRPANCNGVQVYLNPSRIGTLRLYNNTFSNCGHDGIMVNDARHGCEIYNNTVENTGLWQAQEQGTGIALGGYTSAYVHDNTVSSTWLWGIRSFGGKNIRIENNSVTGSGISWAQNICVGPETSYTDTTTFSIKNNYTAQPGSGVSDIAVYKGLYAADNLVCGNTGSLQIDGSVPYSTCQALPVRLFWFSASLLRGYVVLKWEDDGGAESYEVQRSQDSHSWQVLSNTAGNQYMDYHPLSGRSFYRLYFDGQYSPVRIVNTQRGAATIYNVVGQRVQSITSHGIYFFRYVDGTSEAFLY